MSEIIRDNTRRPFQVSAEEYPFESCWADRQGWLQHFVDHGQGRPVLMLHGNPTWSYLYRDIIKGLPEGLRSVAPDHPGMGMSGHPENYGFTPSEHADWIAALIADLDLKDYILVIQDWGGPIGLNAALREPERVGGVMIMNTSCWAPNKMQRQFSWAMSTSLGRYLTLRHNLFVNRIMPMLIADPSKKRKSSIDPYRLPFPTAQSRMPTWVFPKEISGQADWVVETGKKLSLLRDLPCELVVGTQDPSFGQEEFVQGWIHRLPGINVTRVQEAHHFVQKDAPSQVIAAITRISDKLGPAAK